jgi:dynactin-6
MSTLAQVHNAFESSLTSFSTRLSAHASALICLDTDIRGEVTIGAGSVVHPRAAILAVGGPIVIGRNCVLEETAVLVNR